jgi:hypothetical protein
MKWPWEESAGHFKWLILVIAALSIIVLIKERYITVELLKSNKDSIEVTSKILEIIVLFIGSILGYIKFFKGRILKPRIIIKSSGKVIKSDNNNQHWIEIEIQNAGTVTLWDYKISVKAFFDNNINSIIDVNHFIRFPIDHKSAVNLIDVAESSFEHLYLSVPKEVISVTYLISVTDRKGTHWNRSYTIINSEIKAESSN